MIHPFHRHLSNPGQVNGPYMFKAPEKPIRGYDAPARDALYIPLGALNPVNGAGQICGEYNRQSPAFFNVQPVAVVADVSGSGLKAGTTQTAGGLISLSALTTFLKGA